MRRARLRSLICLWLAASVTVGGCRPPAPASRPVTGLAAPAPTTAAPGPAAGDGGRARVAIAADPGGVLTARLPDPDVAAPGVVAAPLPDADARRLLARLEPLPPIGGPAPAMRPPSLPPPAPGGAARPIAFAIPVGKPVADAPILPRAVPPPLAPPQISPQGEVSAESEVRIRFSEPMVPVAQIGTAAIPPATIAPAAAGTWRWLDSRVLVFATSAARFPAATEVVVTVPAGVRAVSGAVLADPVEARFATPPVQISGIYPASTIRPDSPLAIKLDQRIDPDQLVQLLTIRSNGATLAFRPIELAEAERLWAANPSLAYDPARAAELLGKHHVLIAPRTAWPAGATASVSLGIGAPSLEGPRRSTRATSTQFRVAAPFRVRGITCDDHDEPRMAGLSCAARGYATVELSNGIATSSFRAEKVQLEGEPFADHHASGSSVGIWVPAATGRTLAVAIGEGLTDVYGQPLVGPKRPVFAIGPERHDPLVEAPTGLHVLDPRFEIPQWVLRVRAITQLRVQLYQVRPADYVAFAAYERGERPAPPGRKIADVTHAIGVKHGARIRVDLRPALGASGLGHVIAVATAAGAAGHAAAADRVDPGHAARRLGAPRWRASPRVGAGRVAGALPRAAGRRRDDGGRSRAAPPSRRSRPTPPGTPRSSCRRRRRRPPPPGPRVPRGAGAIRSGCSRRPPATTRRSRCSTAASSGRSAAENARWYVTDDRFTYKPGETVYVKGWVRWTHDGVNPDLALPASRRRGRVRARPTRAATRSRPAARRFTEQGGFDLEVALPPNVNLGTARVHVRRRATQSHRHPISIEEFRTPAYAVDARRRRHARRRARRSSSARASR